MSVNERTRKYRYGRVLIETARVLSPAFDDAVVFLSGAQLEMLRNVTQYLRRLDTYVSEYTPGYYLTPTVADYDDILSIVADLEETLMGNPNTLWGYKDRLAESEEAWGDGAADVWVVVGPVPEGEVWVLAEAYGYHEADAAKDLRIYLQGTGAFHYLVQYPSASPGIDHRWQGQVVLKEDDQIVCKVVSPGNGKVVELNVWGTKMVVPV